MRAFGYFSSMSCSKKESMAMRLSRRAGVSLLALFFVSGAVFTSPSQSAEFLIDPNEGWALPNSTGIIGSQNGLFTESNGISNYSALVDHSKLSNDQVDPTCTSTSDSNCNFSNFDFSAQIPICLSSTDENCIESFGATDQNNVDHPGIFQSYYPMKAQNQYTGNPDWNLPSGVSGSLFTIPGVSGPAGNTYYVDLGMSGHGSDQQSPKVTLSAVAASITPVQIQDISAHIIDSRWCKTPTGLCDVGYGLIGPDSNGKLKWGREGNGGADGIHKCVATSWAERSCAEKEAFPAGFKFYLKARFTLPPVGWLHGRLSDPNISVTQSNGVTQILVKAEPVAVPTVYKAFLWADMPTELRALYDPKTGNYIRGGGGGFGRSEPSTNPLLRANTTAPNPYSQSAIAELTAWLPYVDNKASSLPHYWIFNSLAPEELAGANKCFTNPSQLNGIVTTNSSVYSPGPPSFDKAVGDLNYQVAAPHFTNNGDVFHGTYDLVMRSSVARCVYGFSNAPIKASISVVSSSGAPQVATTFVGEKDDWLHLSANNFEFSSPTVKVFLQQEQAVVSATPTPAPSASEASVKQPATKKTAITCTKGKVSKKVVAVYPTCPKGYKKK
jgi:hypothetical protein